MKGVLSFFGAIIHSMKNSSTVVEIHCHLIHVHILSIQLLDEPVFDLFEALLAGGIDLKYVPHFLIFDLSCVNACQTWITSEYITFGGVVFSVMISATHNERTQGAARASMICVAGGGGWGRGNGGKGFGGGRAGGWSVFLCSWCAAEWRRWEGENGWLVFIDWQRLVEICYPLTHCKTRARQRSRMSNRIVI